MATSKPAIPVNKKTAVNTKQVPAKPSKTGTVISSTKKVPAKAVAPVKPMKVVVHGVKQTPKGPAPSKKTITLSKVDSAAIRATNSMDEKARIVAKSALKGTNIPAASKKAIVEAVVKGAKENADKAVAVKRMEVAVKKTGADTKGYQIGTKADYDKALAKRGGVLGTVSITQKPGKAPIAKINGKPASANKAAEVITSEMIKSGKVTREALLKQVGKPSGIPPKKAVAGPIRGLTADKQPKAKAAEPAKKSVKPAAKPTVKSATRAPVVAAKSTTSAPASSQAGSSTDVKKIVEQAVIAANPNTENKFAAAAPKNPFLAAAGAPQPAAKLPPEMSDAKAKEREAFLRSTFRTMQATTRIGS